MEYNIGDKVLIIGVRNRMFECCGAMDCYLNTIMTIASKHYDCFGGAEYKMFEDNGRWTWWSEMIAGKVAPNTNLIERCDFNEY